MTLEILQQEPSTTGVARAGMIYSIEGASLFFPTRNHPHLTLLIFRWHGDPATTRPVQSRNPGAGAPNSTGVDDPDDDDPIDFPDTLVAGGGLNGINPDRTTHGMSFLNPQNLHNNSQSLTSPVNGVSGNNPAIPSSSTNGLASVNEPPVPSASIVTATSAPLPTANGNNLNNNLAGNNISSNNNNNINSIPNFIPPPPIPQSPSDQPIYNIGVTQSMITAYMQCLQVQTQTGRMKMEYLRRREEREERDSAQKRELEKLKLEREAAEFEHQKNSAMVKETADRAIVSLVLPMSHFVRAD